MFKKIKFIKCRNKRESEKQCINDFGKVLKSRNYNFFYFSGGKSLINILKGIKKNLNNKKQYYLTDERIVLTKKNSNYHNLKRFFVNLNFYDLKKLLLIKNKKIKLINDVKNIPNPDILLMGIGEDGHVASIFKKKNTKKNFFICKNKYEKFSRLSISEFKILKAKKIFFFISSLKKKEFVNRIKHHNFSKKTAFERICYYFNKKINIYYF